jgi:hypothetical protein
VLEDLASRTTPATLACCDDFLLISRDVGANGNVRVASMASAQTASNHGILLAMVDTQKRSSIAKSVAEQHEVEEKTETAPL